MTANDNNPNSKEPRRRYRRSLAHTTSAQVQSPPCDAANTSALFDSARNMMINGGQFTAAARNVTININDSVTPPIETEGSTGYSRQRTSNPSRNRRRSSMRPQPIPTGRVQKNNEIYEQHLGNKGRGRLLWIPQPNMVLPIPYRALGAHVGDVGIFTDDGGFDFLFNICVARDNPINPEELPENFVPIYPPISPIDIRKFPQFSQGSHLASSSVTESRTEQSSGLVFESSASEGAILTMPEGAYSEDLSNSSRLNKYIGTHIEDWYRFVNGPRGRDAQNGELHIVIGCDKTTAWGMATFANSSSSQNTNFRLKFSALGEQPSQPNAGNNYRWEHSGVAQVKVGPGRGENEELGETDSNRLQNQCLFLRTLPMMLSQKVWAETFPETVVVTDQNNAHLETQNQSMSCSHGWSTGHWHPQPSMSQSSSQNLPYQSHNKESWISSNFTKSSESYDIANGVPHFSSPESVSVIECVGLASQLTAGAEPSCHRDISSSTPLNLSRYEEIQYHDSIPTPNIILTRPSSCHNISGAVHPSKIISQYLLEQVPHARVAVTQDRDWSGITGIDSCHSDPLQLLSIVRSMNDIVMDIDTGLVYLELREKDQNEMLSEEVKIIESIKDGRVTLDQYLFGFHADGNSDHCLRLRALCNALRSGSTNLIPESSFLIGHPQRPLSLDELCDRGFHDGSIQRRSIVSLRAELSSQPADRSSCLLRLADALSRRFSQWAQKDDLEEAIWSYEEALSLIPNSHYQYLETLLGLCSSLYQRFCLMGHAHDFQNLLRYLELECDVLDRCPSLLAPVEASLKKLCQDSGFSEDPESDGTRDDFAIPDSTDSDRDSDLLGLNPSCVMGKLSSTICLPIQSPALSRHVETTQRVNETSNNSEFNPHVIVTPTPSVTHTDAGVALSSSPTYLPIVSQSGRCGVVPILVPLVSVSITNELQADQKKEAQASTAFGQGLSISGLGLLPKPSFSKAITLHPSHPINTYFSVKTSMYNRPMNLSTQKAKKLFKKRKIPKSLSEIKFCHYGVNTDVFNGNETNGPPAASGSVTSLHVRDTGSLAIRTPSLHVSVTSPDTLFLPVTWAKNPVRKSRSEAYVEAMQKQVQNWTADIRHYSDYLELLLYECPQYNPHRNIDFHASRLLDPDVLMGQPEDDFDFTVMREENDQGSDDGSGATVMAICIPPQSLQVEPFVQPSRFPALADDTYVPLVDGVSASSYNPPFDWSRHLPLNVPLDRPSHDQVLDRLFKFFTSWCLRIIPDLFFGDMYRALNVPPPKTLLHNAPVAVALDFSDEPFKDLKTALSALPSFHRSHGNQILSYMYLGMSARMSQALDLGIDYSKWVKLGLIDDTERLDRYWDVCWPLYVGRDFCIAEPVGAKATPDLSMTDLADSDRYSDLLDLNPSGVIALDDAYERDSDIHFFYHTTSRAGRDILLDCIAFHNSDERYEEPKCHPHTRVAVIGDIMEWVDESKDDPILWLFGPAGAGKSDIAKRILVGLAAERGPLPASFFFSRTSPARLNKDRLVATLAYQLASSIPDTRTRIEETIEQDPYKKNIQTQIDALLTNFLQSTLSTQVTPFSKLFIIDGLDECDDIQAEIAILNAISCSLDKHNLTTIFMVVSRLEHDLVTSFSSCKSLESIHRRLVLYDTCEPESDIVPGRLNFKFDRFKGMIKETHPSRLKSLEELVRKSSGQFIYTTTVLGFVQSNRHRPTDHPEIILGIDSVGSKTRLVELDTLYHPILCSVDEIQATTSHAFSHMPDPLPYIGNGISGHPLVSTAGECHHLPGDITLALSAYNTNPDIPAPKNLGTY